MRIPENHAAETAAAQSQRAGMPQPEGARNEGTHSPGSNGDEIEWSRLSETLRAATSADSPSRAERLARLTADYAAGRYSVDPQSLSRSIVEAALAGD